MVGQTALVIVGNGIAGTTLARQVRKSSGRPITIVSEEHPYFFLSNGIDVCLYGAHAL